MITYVPNSGSSVTMRDGTEKVVGILMSNEELQGDPPYEISGADVVNLADDVVLSAGCVLMTQRKNYTALEDGVFVEKGAAL